MRPLPRSETYGQDLASPLTSRFLGHLEFFEEQATEVMPREQQPIQRPLIIGQHLMWRADVEAYPHQAKLTGTVARDGVDQCKRLLLRAMPGDVGGHLRRSSCTRTGPGLTVH